METFVDNQSKDIGRDTAGVSGESVVCLPCQHFDHSVRSEAQAPCLSNQSVNYQYFKKTWCSLVSYFGAFEVSMLCQPGTRMAIGTGSHHLDLVDFVQQHQPPPSRGHHHPHSVPGQKVNIFAGVNKKLFGSLFGKWGSAVYPKLTQNRDLEK